MAQEDRGHLSTWRLTWKSIVIRDQISDRKMTSWLLDLKTVNAAELWPQCLDFTDLTVCCMTSVSLHFVMWNLFVSYISLHIFFLHHPLTKPLSWGQAHDDGPPCVAFFTDHQLQYLVLLPLQDFLDRHGILRISNEAKLLSHIAGKYSMEYKIINVDSWPFCQFVNNALKWRRCCCYIAEIDSQKA